MITFKKGQVIWRQGVEWEVIRAQLDEVLIEHRVTGAREQAKPFNLLTEYVDGVLKIAQDKLEEIRARAARVPLKHKLQASEAGRIETARRIDYITRLEREGAFKSTQAELRAKIRDVSNARGERRPPHLTTVGRWYRTFVHSLREVQSVIARFDERGGKGKGRLAGEVEDLIFEKIESIFLASKSCSAEAVLNGVYAEIDRRNETRVESQWLRKPGLRTVQRRLHSLYAFDLAVARYGEREAERRFANNLGARPVSRILELIEIDHSPIDCMVVDENRVVIGRPWITLVLDRHSRCVLGFHISLAGHGTEAVFEALRTALLPKVYLRSRYGDLGLDWPCHGWPERVLMDNGREFHANAVVQALVDVGVIGEYAESGEPNDKPHVERFLKTLNYSFIHRLPGTTLAKIHLRVGFKAEDDACITLEELDRMVHVWVCNVYHQRPHGGLDGRSPLSVWQRSAEAFPPQLKVNAEDLEIAFARTATSRIQNDGIDLNTFKFVSAPLLVLRRMLPESARVDVKWPWHEAGHVWVWDSVEKKYIKVPNKDTSLAGLTVDQAKAAKKALASDKDGYRSVAGTADEVVRGMAQAAMKDKKLKNRRKGARGLNMTSKDSRDQRPEPAAVVPSEADFAPFAEGSAQPAFEFELPVGEEIL